ncbi:MAG: glycosyltransferase family 2 protein [Bacteroidota bacterium]
MPLPSNKVIAVVIPTFKRKACVDTLCSQLLAQVLQSVKLEIIVVVDGKTDGTWELLADKYPCVHKIAGNGNWWFTRSVNEGFKYADKQLAPDFGLILNDDLEVEPNYIQTLYEALLSVDSENSIMGSATLTTGNPQKVYFAGTRKIIRWRFKSINYVPFFSDYDAASFTGIRPSESLPGRGTLVPFTILKALNYLDEVFVQYASDDDFCLRALKKGFKVFISLDARVYSHIDLTGVGASYIKYPFKVFLKSLFNPYSSLHLGTALRMVLRHGDKRVLPLGIAIAVAGKFKAYFFNKKHF